MTLTAQDTILLRELAETVRRATDATDIWDAVIGALPAGGFKMFTYYHFPPFGASDAHDPLVVTHGYPERLVDLYFTQRLYLIDPFARVAKIVGFPFLFSEVGKLAQLTDGETEYLRRRERAGLGDGLAIPVFGPGGRNACASLTFERGHERALDDTDRLAMQTVAQAAHLRYCELWNRQQPRPTTLSPREREILKWVARGKSNNVISDIIGISPNTVDTHLRRIYSKLDVGDRVSAAIRGVGSGLIAA